MIGRCANCGNEEIRYGVDEVMKAACNVCGSFIFWCLHFGVYRGVHIPSMNHWVKIDLRTNELLSKDLCDEDK